MYQDYVELKKKKKKHTHIHTKNFINLRVKKQ